MGYILSADDACRGLIAMVLRRAIWDAGGRLSFGGGKQLSDADKAQIQREATEWLRTDGLHWADIIDLYGVIERWLIDRNIEPAPDEIFDMEAEWNQ